MGGMRRRTLLACSVVSIGFLGVGQAGAQGAGVWLVTGSEAALPPSATSKAGRSITRGPAIRQVAPANAVAANQPFALKVEFAGRGGEKINPASAQVAVLRGSDINITDRLKPYITANGIEIADARVPAGTYVLQVTVSDAGGRQSIANIEIDAR
jgi:hypothetical protein